MARLLLKVLLNYRDENRYLLHEFVLMPDHSRLLITPAQTIERALQCIKGGFSYRAKREFGYGGEVWEKSFHDRRVRDIQENGAFRRYIHLNPVKRGLVSAPELYPYSSALQDCLLDEIPQRLKPLQMGA